MTAHDITETAASVELTPEELTLLSPFDCLAHDIMRMEAARIDQAPPCWLCCSDDARETARQAAIDTLQAALDHGLGNEDAGVVKWDLESARRFARDRVSPAMLQRWRDAELEFKRLRIAGHPVAFFAA